MIRAPCISRGKALIRFVANLSITQITRISPRLGGVRPFVYTFRRRKKHFWISLRDTDIRTGVSSSKNFSPCIHHRMFQTVYNFCRRSPSPKFLIQRSEDQTVIPFSSLRHLECQSVHHRQVFVRCAESRTIASVNVQRLSSLYSWVSVTWIRMVEYSSRMVLHFPNQTEQESNRTRSL